MVQTTIALSLTQVLSSFFKDESVPLAERLEVFQYFGTASRAMFTMFELTLANWTIVGRVMSENVSATWQMKSKKMCAMQQIKVYTIQYTVCIMYQCYSYSML